MDTLVITLPETNSLRSFASEKYDQGTPKREMNQLNQPLDFRSEVQKGQSNPENCQDGNPESCDRESLL